MNYDFLPFFINEQIYIVKEPEPTLNYETIVVEKTIPIEEKSEEIPEVISVGDFKKQILFIVENPGKEVLPADHYQLLKNIMDAVKLGISDVAIVNVYNLNVHNLERVLKGYDYKILISFGVDSVVDKNAVPYKITRQEKNITLLVDELGSLSADVGRKKRLWENLQQLFR